MATRTSNGKSLGKVQTWGIAQVNLDGSVDLIEVANGRLAIRAIKREVFPGGAYKVVKVDAKLVTYNK